MFGAIVLYLLIAHSWAFHVTWIYPVDNSQVFNVRDTVWLTWLSNTVETSMNMWCFNVKSRYWEPPLNHGNPWAVPSSGSYKLTFDDLSSHYEGGCHIGFYNQSADHETLPSIGNSATFKLSFDHQAYSHVWGKSEKLNKPGNTEPLHPTAPNDPVPASAKGSSRAKQGSGGLSTAAQAGIGVAAAIVIIAVAVSIYVYWRLRSRRLAKPHRKAHELPNDSETAHMPPSGENTLVPPSLKPSHPNTPRGLEKQQHQQPQQIHEAAGDTRFLPSELDGTARSELSS